MAFPLCGKCPGVRPVSQGKANVLIGTLSQHVNFQVDSTPKGQTGEVLLRERKTGPKIVAVLTAGRLATYTRERPAPAAVYLSLGHRASL